MKGCVVSDVPGHPRPCGTFSRVAHRSKSQINPSERRGKRNLGSPETKAVMGRKGKYTKERARKEVARTSSGVERRRSRQGKWFGLGGRLNNCVSGESPVGISRKKTLPTSAADAGVQTPSSQNQSPCPDRRLSTPLPVRTTPLKFRSTPATTSVVKKRPQAEPPTNFSCRIFPDTPPQAPALTTRDHTTRESTA